MTEHDDRHDPQEPDQKALAAEPTASGAPLAPRTTGRKPELPVVVLRDMVIYPGVTVPMSVGRANTLSAIQAAAESADGKFFALLQREKSDEVDPLGLHTIGVTARVVQLHQGLGGTQALVQGLHRGIALRVDSTEAHLVATVSPAEEFMPVDPDDLAFVALDEELRNRAAELGARAGIPSEVLNKTLRAVNDPGRLADLVAGHLELPASDHQSLLETLAVEERMRRVLMLVQRRIKLLDAQQDINTQVEEEIGDRQREMYLREQLKAIRKELGDDDGADDLEELKERVAGLELPPAARKEVDRELRRLARMGRESMESQVIRTYVETVCELPWSELSDERLDLADAARILDEDHYGLEDTKDRILEFLAVRVMHDRQARRQQLHTDTADEAAADSPEAAETRDRDGEAERSPILPVHRTSRRRQDIDRQVDRPAPWAASTYGSPWAAPGDEGGHPRTPAHLRRRDAGAHPPRHEAGGRQEPGVPARRSRQARRLASGRSVGRAARGSGRGTERRLHRPLPRSPPTT